MQSTCWVLEFSQAIYTDYLYEVKEVKVEILGTGCPKCMKLEAMVKTVIDNMDIDAQITHIHDIEEILSYDVMMTPALVVDGVVKSSGKLPSEADLRTYLQ